MKLFILGGCTVCLLLLVLINCKQVDAVSATIHPQKFAVIDYAPTPPGGIGWLDERYEVRIAGDKPIKESVKFFGYLNFNGIIGDKKEYFDMKEFVQSRGWELEQIFIHAKKNYISKPHLAAIWQKMDMFDVFEGKNGVLKTKDGIKYNDLTKYAYEGDVKISDQMFFGYEEPFAEVRFTLKDAGKGVISSWSYWNGNEWKSLKSNDGTLDFTSSGIVSFIPPIDWEPVSLNNSRPKFFVRLHISKGYVYPVSRNIRGDDWLNGGPNAGRGWDPASASIVKGKYFSFNPSPPAVASARFPYQARLTFWAPNNFVANQSNMQSFLGVKVRPWAVFIADQCLKAAKKGGFQGIMLDDVSKFIVHDFSITERDTDFPLTSTVTDKERDSIWMKARAESVSEIKNNLKFANSPISIGANSQHKDLVKVADWNLAEFHTNVCQTDSPRGIDVTDDGGVRTTYDSYLISNFPAEKFGILIYADAIDVREAGKGKTPYFWERNNRGPLTALSKHYIATNDHTLFAYQSMGGNIYNHTDEVYYYGEEKAILKVAMPVDKSGSVKTLKSSPGSFKAFPRVGIFRVGDNVGRYQKVNDSEITTRHPFWWAVSPGTPVLQVIIGHQSMGGFYPIENVYQWGAWFPAMGVDIGVPDTNGFNGGLRDLNWKKAKEIMPSKDLPQYGDIWRRDYTHALVLHRPASWSTTIEMYETYSKPVDLDGEYFPLRADGTTGEPIKKIALRCGEGAILMKNKLVPKLINPRK